MSALDNSDSTVLPDTRARYELLELDTPAVAPALRKPTRALTSVSRPATVTAAVASSVVSVPAPSTEVSQTVRDFASAEAAIAKEHGLGTGDVDKGLFFDAGTQLWDVGETNLRLYEQAYKALPTLAEAAQVHAATIAAEQRKDSEVALSDFRFDGEGRLRPFKSDSNGAQYGAWSIAVSGQACRQLIQRYPHDREIHAWNGSERRAQYPSGKALPAAPNNFNGWLGDLVDENGQPEKQLIRARGHRGQREIFAVFAASKRGYTAFDTDRFLTEAAKVQPDLRAELTYDADTTRMRCRVMAQAPIDVPAFNGVGRVHRIGFDLVSTDDGSSSLRVQPFLIRVRCKNASLVLTNGKRSTYRHVGSFETLKTAIATAIESASKAIESMRALWAQRATEWYLDSESGGQLSVHEAIKRLVAHEYLPTGGLSPDAAVNAYLGAWRAEESPSSAMGIIMAIQRAAHEVSWATTWAQDEIEEAGAKLLYNHVLRLDAIED